MRSSHKEENCQQRHGMVFDEAYTLMKGEDEASADSQKEKIVMEVELDDQRSLMNECDDEESLRDAQH